MVLVVDTLKWFDPRNWPFIVWLWIGIALLANASALWRWYQKRRALSSWTITSAEVKLACITSPNGIKDQFTKRRGSVTAELQYSYSVEGQQYAGSYKRDCQDEVEAAEFVRGMEGQAVTIRFNPNKPSKSLLPDAEIQAVQANRAPAPEFQAARQLPAWVKPFLWPLAILALVGLAISIAVHLAALLGRELLPMSFFFLLHMGLFVVWFPAVFVAKKLKINNDLKSMLRDSPVWMRTMDMVLFVYAMANFAIFFIQSSSYGKKVPQVLEWRGFSGHWMLFYAAAFTVLYSAATVPDVES